LLRVFLAVSLFAVAALAQPRSAPKSGYREWSAYQGGPESIHYSALNQINRGNVEKLKVAWTFDTGDSFSGSELQCNPIVAHGILYASTPKLRVVALDAATGDLRWSFDPNDGIRALGKMRNRGLTYWEQGTDHRIFVASRHLLYALNAATGKPIATFGDSGHIDLREGLGRPPAELFVSASSPGIIYKDMLIMGSLVPETLPGAPGDIRAYDVRTGKIRWSFHTIPHPGEFGYETWPKDAWKYSGGANNWSGMSLDEKRGLVFASTGSASFDFYGANRVGDNLFANCVLALNAATGERVWHFQGVRHDVWDRDFPAPPSLVTVRRDGRLIDAVAQISKSGFVFVLDRATGKPLFPVEERSAPASQVDGEVLAKMQPFPVKPPPFARQTLTEDMLTTRTPEAHAAAVEQFRKLHSNGQSTPPSFEGTIIFPGYDGGGEWGGASFDPESGLLYVNANEMAWILKVVERPVAKEKTSAVVLYKQNCASCHREDRRGTPPEFPSRMTIAKKYSASEVASIIRRGNGRMPAFPQLRAEAVQAITSYLMTGEDVATTGGTSADYMPKYGTDGYNKFLDPDGYPAVQPPWGTLNAINLDTGEIAWKIPFGEFPELAAKGMGNTGTENYGGGVVTAGGLLFIGATNHDRKFHAFDKATGKLLWETTLPAAGNATPATYEVNGKQFVVIAAGGGKSKAPSGGSYVAFALE
jgi:quinoprotein glucose dehydrogenase